jgi:hypothetical protein
MTIRLDHRKLYKQAQGYKRPRGKALVYDLRRAEKDLPLFRKNRIGTNRNIWGGGFFKKESSKYLYRLGNSIRKNYIEVLEPRDYPEPYVPVRQVFGRIEGRLGYNALMEEIKQLILRGEGFEKHKRRMRRTYHLKIVGGFDELAELWRDISRDVQELKERMSPGEIKAWEVVNNLGECHAPKPTRNRSKKRQPAA